MIVFPQNMDLSCVTGSAVGFKLDSLLKLSDTRARNNKMTLMHYLCKVCGSNFKAYQLSQGPLML